MRWNLRSAFSVFAVWVFATLVIANALVVYSGFGSQPIESRVEDISPSQAIEEYSRVITIMLVPGGILTGAILALLSRLHRPQINGNGAALALLPLAGVGVSINWLIDAAVVVVAMVAVTAVLGTVLWLSLQQRRYYSVREE